MPTYEYNCQCGNQWDVIKRVADIDEVELCDKCQRLGDRQISRTSFAGAADWNTQHFSPALGKVVKNNREARQLAKDRGMLEVGNEKPEVIHKHFDTQREDTREQRWKDADRVKVYD